jgi:hypothetical protein
VAQTQASIEMRLDGFLCHPQKETCRERTVTRSLFLSAWKLPAARPEKESGKCLSPWIGLYVIICPAKRIQILTLNAESAAWEGAFAKGIPIQERKRAGERKPVAA